MTSFPTGAPRRRAFTLVEVLVALAIGMIFVTSLAAAYIQISRAHAVALARAQATNRGRAALEEIARGMKQVATDITIADQQFLVTNVDQANGDGRDDDRDGVADEELADATDNDADWALADDRHTVLGAFTERSPYVGVADLGDGRVDEDVLFSSDVLTYRVPAAIPFVTDSQLVRYRIGTFDGQDRVLLREVIVNPPAGDVDAIYAAAINIETTPVIFDVLSFNVLPFNSNQGLNTTPQPYWQTAWNAQLIQTPQQEPYGVPVGFPFPIPPFEFPSAVRVEITTSAETVPLSELGNLTALGRPLETVSVNTTVTIESVTNSIFYFFFTRPVI